MVDKIKILIIDDDADEALLLATVLYLNNYAPYISPTIFRDAIKAIEHHLPDIIILSMNHAQEDIIGLEIATHIHQIYYIPVLLQVEFHYKEDLQQYIDTLPYSCILKPNENNFDQLLNTLQFSVPHIVGKLCKYKATTLRVTRMEIDPKGEPVSIEGLEHLFEDKEIKLCDVLYFKAGNTYFKNCVLVRLQSDKNHYYAFRGTLAQCLLWLNNKLFTHINGSYIVSNEKITASNLPTSVTIDDIVIPVSRNYIADINKVIKERRFKA